MGHSKATLTRSVAGLALLAFVLPACGGGGGGGGGTPDTMPPTFGGVATATAGGPGCVMLTWTAATDDVSAPGQIVYQVFTSTLSGMFNFASPILTTPPGAVSAEVGTLADSTTHFFVVRARDAAGNTETNTVEASDMTTAASVTFGTDVWTNIISQRCFPCHTPGGTASFLDMSTANATYMNWVNVPAVTLSCIGRTRVIPCDSANSLVFNKVDTTFTNLCGPTMPFGGPPLSAGDQTTIQTWIDEGAIDN